MEEKSYVRRSVAFARAAEDAEQAYESVSVASGAVRR